MAGPFPLSTLGPTITSTGITIPSYSDIYTSLQASFASIYGSDSYLLPDSQDGEMLAIVAQAIDDQNNAIVALYQSFSPSFAQGVDLSLLVRINGLTRLVATNSTVTVTLTGTVGTVITNGIVQDTNNNLWNLPVSVTIPGGGSIAVTATAQQLGAIVAPTSSVNTIYTPQLGWASVNNPTYAAVPGAPIESDAALRIRQALSTSLPALTPLSAIAALIASLPGVQRSLVYENDTAITDGNGVPSHSISVITEGGDSTAIAQAIESKKSPGTGTYGTTTVTVEDPSGLPVTINFFQLAFTQIYISVTIKALTGYVSTTTTAIQTALIAFINALAIGGEVYYSQLYPAAQLDALGLGTSFYITSLTVGTAPSPGGTSNIPILFNYAAETDATKVLITVT